MVETQLHEKVQIFQSDNGREYFNGHLGNFFTSKGILHQCSCPNTPQQYMVGERKNRHLMVVTRTLIFTSGVPKFLWREAFLTSTYHIHRMSSRVVGFKTPFNMFEIYFSTSRLTTYLSLRVFGYSVYVHVQDHNRSKVDSTC